jgi:hypothetical protein
MAGQHSTAPTAPTTQEALAAIADALGEALDRAGVIRSLSRAETVRDAVAQAVESGNVDSMVYALGQLTATWKARP